MIPLAYTLQDITNLDEPLLLNSFVSHQFLTTVQFLDKWKPLRDGLFEVFTKPTEVTFEHLTQNENSNSHTYKSVVAI